MQLMAMAHTTQTSTAILGMLMLAILLRQCHGSRLPPQQHPAQLQAAAGLQRLLSTGQLRKLLETHVNTAVFFNRTHKAAEWERKFKDWDSSAALAEPSA